MHQCTRVYVNLTMEETEADCTLPWRPPAHAHGDNVQHVVRTLDRAHAGACFQRQVKDQAGFLLSDAARPRDVVL